MMGLLYRDIKVKVSEDNAADAFQNTNAKKYHHISFNFEFIFSNSVPLICLTHPLKDILPQLQGCAILVDIQD